jgi:DNA-binding LytR/AlgR family response regulator
MHYVAMFSTSFIPISDVGELAAPVFTQDYMAIVVAVVSFVLCGLFLLLALPDEKRQRQEPATKLAPDAVTSEINSPFVPLANVEETPAHRRIPVRKNGATLYLSTGDIVMVTAQGHYTTVANVEGEYFCDLSISKLAKMLDRGQFARPHRSHLVNLRYVQGFSKKGDRGFLILDGSDEKTVPVSRSKIKGILQRLEFEPDYSSYVSST